MKTFFKEYLQLILIMICEIVIGILLLVNPVELCRRIIISVGIGLSSLGLYKVIRYFCTVPVKGKHLHGLSTGILLLSVGITGIVMNTAISNMLTGMNILFGCIMFVGCTLKLEMTVEMLRSKYGNVLLMSIAAVTTLLFSVLMLLDVYSMTEKPMLLAGISFLVEVIMDVFIMFFRRPIPKNVKASPEE